MYMYGRFSYLVSNGWGQPVRLYFEGATPAEGVRLKACPSTASIHFDRATVKKLQKNTNQADVGDDSDDKENKVDGGGVRPGDDGGTADEGARRGTSASLPPGGDPPLGEVLRAWPPSVVAARAEAAGVTQNALLASCMGKHSEMAAGAAVAEEATTEERRTSLFAFEERRVSGAAVPSRLYDALLRALQTARWPPVTHRNRVDSERYLVVTAEMKCGGGDGGGDHNRRAVDPYVAGASIHPLPSLNSPVFASLITTVTTTLSLTRSECNCIT